MKQSRVMQDLSVVLLSAAIQIGGAVLAMIEGWGLEPKSWPWIIGMGWVVVFGRAVIHLFPGDKAKQEGSGDADGQE